MWVCEAGNREKPGGVGRGWLTEGEGGTGSLLLKAPESTRALNALKIDFTGRRASSREATGSSMMRRITTVALEAEEAMFSGVKVTFLRLRA